MCKGDSGGPIMWFNSNTSRYTIIGKVSSFYINNQKIFEV